MIRRPPRSTLTDTLFPCPTLLLSEHIKLKETKLGYDPGRGAQVFQQNCASCHGADGQGQRDINGRVVFPPLWGPHSYNWGAGMASVKNAAAFVKKNMPLGQTDRLTDQQAWDVAAYIDKIGREH